MHGRPAGFVVGVAPAKLCAAMRVVGPAVAAYAGAFVNTFGFAGGGDASPAGGTTVCGPPSGVSFDDGSPSSPGSSPGGGSVAFMSGASPGRTRYGLPASNPPHAASARL